MIYCHGNETVVSQDYYSVHGENAIYIAKTFYKTLAVVKYIGGSNGLPGGPRQKCLYALQMLSRLHNDESKTRQPLEKLKAILVFCMFAHPYLLP